MKVIQTVTADTGEFHRVLAQFHIHTGCLAVLNTSFDGPGEPIAETPAQALATFLKHDLDVLYPADGRVTRRGV